MAGEIAWMAGTITFEAKHTWPGRLPGSQVTVALVVQTI